MADHHFLLTSLKRSMTTQDESPAVLKALWIWLAVGVSQMSPLQFVQFVAAIFATVYSAVLIVKTISEMWRKRKENQ